MNKAMTEHARAAKAIREDLKKAFPSVKFRVKSSSFSGGDAVDVYWSNGPTMDEVDSIIGKYQYGHFDGMTDCYGYSNNRKDIPQTKYVQVNRALSLCPGAPGQG